MQLEHIAGQPAPKPTRVLLDIPVDERLEHWNVTAGSKGIEARNDKDAGPGRFALHLLPRHAPIIEFALDLDPSEFNLVQVVGITRRHRTLKIELLAGTTVVHSSNVAPLPPMGTPQLVYFPIPKLDPMPARITGMRLKVSSGGNRSRLLGVQIVDRTVTDRMEGTPSDPQLIHLGAETRRGVGLSSKHPLITRLPEGFDGEMTFSYAPAPNEDAEVERGRLLVQVLRAGILDQGQLFDFEPDDRFPRWGEGGLSLMAPADADTQVQFSLVDAYEEDGLCALGLPELISRREKPKTVLLVTSDTHRADYLGASNSGVFVKTPDLDALAARGVLFEDCGSVTNVTNPSHIAMLTGTPVRDTGIVDNATPVSEQAETLAEAFSNRGYLTYASASAG
ncbi:MAG: hypothetical protein ACI8QC_002574 [Planctomycetota bacterium]